MVHATDIETSEKLVRDFFNVINGEVSEIKNDDQQIEKLVEIAKTYGDGEVIARQVLGVAGRGLTKAQLADFSDAYLRYFFTKYGTNFSNLGGYDLQLKKSHKMSSYVRVDSYVTNRFGERFDVKILVIERQGKTRFFNFVIEGFNLVLNERQEIALLLGRRGGDIDRLIRDLPNLVKYMR